MACEEEPIQQAIEEPQVSHDGAESPVGARIRRTHVAFAALLGAVLGGIIMPSLLQHVQTAKADEPTVPRPDGERISSLAAAIGILVNRLAKLEGGLVLNEGPRAEENEKLLRNAQEAARVAGEEDPREKCVRKLVQQGLMSPTLHSLRGRKPDAKQTLNFIRRAAASATYTRANFLTIGSGMLSPYPDTESVSNPVDCRLTMQIEFLPNTESLPRRSTTRKK